MSDLPCRRCGKQHVKGKALADVASPVVCCQRHVGCRLENCHVASPCGGAEVIRTGGSYLHWSREINRVFQIHEPPLCRITVRWERSTRSLVALVNRPIGKTRRQI